MTLALLLYLITLDKAESPVELSHKFLFKLPGGIEMEADLCTIHNAHFTSLESEIEVKLVSFEEDVFFLEVTETRQGQTEVAQFPVYDEFYYRAFGSHGISAKYMGSGPEQNMTPGTCCLTCNGTTACACAVKLCNLCCTTKYCTTCDDE